jgi:hypothetical protein
MKLLHWLAALVLASAILGCGGRESVRTDDETVSLVFGYFDMKEGSGKLDWVQLKQYDLEGKKPVFYAMNAKDGLFFHVGVEPGSYQVDKFGYDGGLFSNPIEYSFGGKGRNRTAIRIQKPGVYFVGAHRYVNVPGKGFFDAAKFDMQPATSPSEKEILQRVVQKMESDKDLQVYTRQLRLAKQRLSQL